MQPLRIVADANIPAAREAFGRFGSVRLLPGREITRAAAESADVLLVRSVTRVDEALVGGTPVRFVGTATAGTDHVDTDALARLGVAFASAPGSNATSVVEYVLAALLAVASDRGEDIAGKTLGVVGVGAVGGRLVPRARALGMSVLVCDPPRVAAGHLDHDYLPPDDVLAGSDIVTLHTPLTGLHESPWPTRGLISARNLASMKPSAWLVNAARGEVVDGPALLAERPRPLLFDCWPGEPAPDPRLVDRVTLGTPHIAGYSAEGKLAGTAMVAEALRDWASAEGLNAPWTAPAAVARFVDAPNRAQHATNTSWLADLQGATYSILDDDGRFRAAMAATGPDPSARAAAFAELRRTYPTRHENAAFVVRDHVPVDLRRAVTEGLGMRIEDDQQPPAGGRAAPAVGGRFRDGTAELPPTPPAAESPPRGGG